VAYSKKKENAFLKKSPTYAKRARSSITKKKKDSEREGAPRQHKKNQNDSDSERFKEKKKEFLIS